MVKNISFRVSQTWSPIPALPLPSWVTLGCSLTSLILYFLFCETEKLRAFIWRVVVSNRVLCVVPDTWHMGMPAAASREDGRNNRLNCPCHRDEAQSPGFLSSSCRSSRWPWVWCKEGKCQMPSGIPKHYPNTVPSSLDLRLHVTWNLRCIFLSNSIQKKYRWLIERCITYEAKLQSWQVKWQTQACKQIKIDHKIKLLYELSFKLRKS